MRLSVEMLNDWNNNTCEGQYLKSLYENRIQKHNGEKYFGVKACICALSTALRWSVSYGITRCKKQRNVFDGWLRW